MCVLIEALTLVVPTINLDISYPGGSDAFLQAMLDLERPPRFVCNADPDLVNISFYDPQHADPAEQLLTSCLIGLDHKSLTMVDFAWVDQHFGPSMPTPWLEWRRHEDGFTYAWRVYTDPGDMAAPVDWTPECSSRLVRTDFRDMKCAFPLQRTDDHEIWLDLETGQQIIGLPHSGKVEPC
jgi:hypothetical protein